MIIHKKTKSIKIFKNYGQNIHKYTIFHVLQKNIIKKLKEYENDDDCVKMGKEWV